MVKSKISFLLLFIFFVSPVFGELSVAERLQEVSVTLNTGQSEGSGCIVKRGDYNYVLTAGHVVANLRKTRSVIDVLSGNEKKVIEFDSAKIIQVSYEEGRKVGQVEMLADIICYSDSDNGEDLAVLKVLKKNFINSSTNFYIEDTIPSVGTDLYHVGSLLGQGGSNSCTTGIISQTGRIHEGKLYDQTSCTAFPGSSGGGVFLRDGRYVGAILRGTGEGFNLMVPIRRVKKWLTKMNLLFIIDPSVPIPTDEELKKVPIEDAGRSFPKTNSEQKHIPFLIRDLAQQPETEKL